MASLTDFRNAIVFVDASFWVALIHHEDQYHPVSEDIWDRLLRHDATIITTNWTLYEALTFLNSRRRGRHDLAMELHALAMNSGEIVDASAYEQQALEIFRSHTDKRWSVVDCANFVCIRERHSTMALSFDRDFAQAQAEFGFAVLGAGAS
ncbi:MAG: type II toxin-antitoxin system VapC family toxin [Chloroflexi bacterium]|nr:type II toxin-antitoxin system VapC family toxin [Chloroflexota bacterium]